MSKKLEEIDTTTLMRVVDHKEEMPEFTERQVLRELDGRDLTGLSQRDQAILAFARSRHRLYESYRDRYKTRGMSVVELLKKLSESLRVDYDRKMYIRELDIRQEEGELTEEQQLTLQQLKDDIKEGSREAMEQIKKGMRGFVEAMEGREKKLN